MFPAPMSNNSSRKYRSRRAVRTKEIPTHFVTKWTKTKVMLVCLGGSILAMTTILPVLILESTMTKSGGANVPVSLHSLVQKSREVEEEYKEKGTDFWKKATDKIRGALHVRPPGEPIT